MALKLVAVEGTTLKITTVGASANLEITTPGSPNDKHEDKAVLRGPIIVVATNGTFGACGSVTPAVGGGTIVPTATRDKSNGLAVIRKGDKITIQMGGTAPGPVACSFPMDIEIDDPGQSTVRGQ